MLTIDPPSFFSISGTAARVSAWAVETLKWKASSRYAASVSSRRVGDGAADVVDHDVEPAELVVRRVGERRDGVEVHQVGRYDERPPTERPRCALATFSSWSAVRAESTTSAPASASAIALAGTDPSTGAGDDRDLPVHPEPVQNHAENVTGSSSTGKG